MAPKDTSRQLAALRKAMKDQKYVQESLGAYIIPSCDAHDSEYLADVDQRRQYMSGFTGSAGTAIVTTSQVMNKTLKKFCNVFLIYTFYRLCFGRTEDTTYRYELLITVKNPYIQYAARTPNI